MDSIREDEIDLDMENVDKSSIKKKKRKLELNKAILDDDRFKEMFENKVWNFTGCFSVLLLDCSLAHTTHISTVHVGSCIYIKRNYNISQSFYPDFYLVLSYACAMLLLFVLACETSCTHSRYLILR
jgi:hypothetical protein